MYWRFALGGVGWLALLGLFVAGLQSGRVPKGLPPPEHAPALVRSLNEPQSTTGEWWSWRVTRATAAHATLVVDVEAQRVSEARAIALQIVEPVRTHGYDEILIYVHPAARAVNDTARRVQWTPRGGFVELILSE